MGTKQYEQFKKRYTLEDTSPHLSGSLLSKAIAAGDFVAQNPRKRVHLFCSAAQVNQVRSWLRTYYPASAHKIDVRLPSMDTRQADERRTGRGQR